MSPLFENWPGKENALAIDLSVDNEALNRLNAKDTLVLRQYIFGEMEKHDTTFAWGGYEERRNWYQRSEHFTSKGESRDLHLGIDIWAKEATAVYCPLGARVIGFADNAGFGNYGPTVIVQFEQRDQYCLFGHLSRMSLFGLKPGMILKEGQILGELGSEEENGEWPPHLHLQLINDLGKWRSDFPGVCRNRSKASYLANSPDPEFLLG